LFAAEAITGPSCPSGADCASIGARGALGTPWSLVLIIVFAAVSWGLARLMYAAAARRRPASGRVSAAIVTTAMLWLLVLPGAVIAATLMGADLLVRDTPAYAQRAMDEVTKECFSVTADPDLAVRAAPSGYSTEWTTFAVRNADEHRKGIGKQGLPDDWRSLKQVHPYEATASFNADGDLVDVACQKVDPSTGRATAADLTQEEPDSNPLSPKTIGHEFLPRFFADGVAGPTPEAAKQQAAAAKAAKATSKKNAKATSSASSSK
jgi:hypothetical protein